jgi:hypothetical protein
MMIFSFLRNLPVWVLLAVAFLILTVLVGAGFLFGPTIAIFLFVGLIFVALSMAVFLFILHSMRQRRAMAFGGEISRQTALGAPGSSNDPARQARLDDLKRNFIGGLSKFRATGKDLYKLPWYVIAGEPGAGKTEAIRHSGVGFPPGMQDDFQGVGGTINMNWWFTNQAVILDTAGRLMFEEVEPGSTNEWREFLGLLKKNRPNCPINGLLLAIPADSLIRDENNNVERKAGKIARQLENIQKQFDLRFPVFVVITKCDLLNGFREFFDNIDDPQGQGQMLGWSNPDPLDAPFRPELIDEHFETALFRLRRRRLALLQDPVAHAGPTERRLDEVDRLYALPQSLALMAPRLRRYLEVIFTAGEWSAKPLFLRGIYFTSALREGSALDQELAEALNVDVASLPEGRAWEREQTLFLRDVFLEKVFRESGLVTRATDTKRLVRQRQFAVFGAGFAALALLGLLSFLAQRSLQKSIGRQGGYWLRAAEGWDSKNRWQPIVEPSAEGGGKGNAPYVYTGDQAVGRGDRENTRLLFEGGEQNREQFQTALRQLADVPLSVSWIFRPLAAFGVGIDSDRRAAQRVVFEGNVVKPLLDATRARMTDPAPRPAPMPASEAEALLALVRLESAVSKPAAMDADAGESWRNRFLNPLLAYVTEQAPAAGAASEFTNVAGWTYSPLGSKENWALDWAAGGNNLNSNQPLNAGLDRFAISARDAVRNQGRRLALLGELADIVRQYRDKETELYNAVTSREPVEKIDPAVFNFSNQLQDRKNTLDRKLAELGATGLFGKDLLLLVSGYERSTQLVRQHINIIKQMLVECDQFAPVNVPKDPTGGRILSYNQQQAAKLAGKAFNELGRTALFTQIGARLRALLPELEGALTQGAAPEAMLTEWKALDEQYLADYGDGRRLYTVRWDLYYVAIKATPGITYAQTLQLIGSEWKPLQEIFNTIAQQRGKVNEYQKGLKERLSAIVGYCLTRAERVHSQEFPKAYMAQVKGKIKSTLRYPFVWPPGLDDEALKRDEFRAAGSMLRGIERDLKSPVLAGLRTPAKGELLVYGQKLAPLINIALALSGPDGTPSMCTVTMLSGSKQRELSSNFSALDIWPAIEIRAGSYRHGGRVTSGSAMVGKGSDDKPGDTQLGRFAIDDPFHFHFFKSLGDTRIDVDLPCAENYTAVRLVNELFGAGRPDGNAWIVPVKADGQRALWLRIEFQKALPPHREWPTKYGLDLGE